MEGKQTHSTKGRGKLVKKKNKPACQRNHAQVSGSSQKKKSKEKGRGKLWVLFVCFVLSNSEKWAGPAGRTTTGLYVTEGRRVFFFFF